MPKPYALNSLGRRERQIMDVVYELGRATVADVLARLPDPPSYSSVRAMLRLLEEKGHLKHVEEGPRYVYLPKVPATRVSTSALQQVVRTFFQGSTEAAMTALLESGEGELDDEALRRLSAIIARAQTDGR